MSKRLTDTVQLYLAAVTANTTLSVPAGYAIRDMFITNNTANAVTGGVRIGTTDGGVDVLVTLAVGANAVTLGVPLLRRFATAQTLFIQAVVAWNSASLDIVITLDRAVP